MRVIELHNPMDFGEGFWQTDVPLVVEADLRQKHQLAALLLLAAEDPHDDACSLHYVVRDSKDKRLKVVGIDGRELAWPLLILQLGPQAALGHHLRKEKH